MFHNLGAFFLDKNICKPKCSRGPLWRQRTYPPVYGNGLTHSRQISLYIYCITLYTQYSLYIMLYCAPFQFTSICTVLSLISTHVPLDLATPSHFSDSEKAKIVLNIIHFTINYMVQLHCLKPRSTFFYELSTFLYEFSTFFHEFSK